MTSRDTFMIDTNLTSGRFARKLLQGYSTLRSSVKKNVGGDIFIIVSSGKWTKLEHMFITHKSYRNLGGTLEITANVADLGNRITDLHLHGSGYLVRDYCCEDIWQR